MAKASGTSRVQMIPGRSVKVREVSPEEFSPHYIERIREEDPELAMFLDFYDPERMRRNGTRCYEIEVDGVRIDAGFAIMERDGGARELFAVSKRPSTPHKGVGKLIAREAVARGATNLFAFNTEPLRAAYQSAGFRAYKYAPFDPALAPTGWNYGRFGTPSVVWMKLPSVGSTDADWWPKD